MARQKKRIIVEGVDGSGKTTLVDALIDRIGNMKLVRNVHGPDQDFDTWWKQILLAPPDGQTPIHDRFFYSELVYGPVIRGTINADLNLVLDIQKLLANEALLIYARPDIRRLELGAKVNEQMEGVHERFIQLLELYDQTMAIEAVHFGNRFVQYVWYRDNELERVEGIVRRYIAGGLS